MRNQIQTTLLSNKRQAEILKSLRLKGSCSIIDLAIELAVSDETIRRNVKILAAQGLVEKIRGGVMMPRNLSEAAFPLRMNEGKEAKQKIAAKIASKIQNGDSLILDNGSTTAYIAQALVNHKDLLVVTNSVVIASILAILPGNRVFMAGGELRNHDGGAFGPEAFDLVKKFEVNCAIFSTSAIHPEKGFLVHYLCESEFARAIIKRSEKTIIAADSSKFGRKAPMLLCDADNIDELVTDMQPPDGISNLLNNNGIKLTITD